MRYDLYTEQLLLSHEERHGTRAIAQSLLSTHRLSLNVFQLYWLVRRNYSFEVCELLDEQGTELLDRVPTNSLADFLRHLPYKAVSNVAHKSFWLANFERRVYLRPYISNPLAIQILNAEYLKNDNFITYNTKLIEAIEYCISKGLIEKTVNSHPSDIYTDHIIGLTKDYNVIECGENKELFKDFYNFGLKYTFPLGIRAIKYQINSVRNKAFEIIDNLGVAHYSNKHKLLSCDAHGIAIAYFFESIKQVILVHGWIAWPILIYDVSGKILFNTGQMRGLNVENFRPYLELIDWKNVVSATDRGALLIGFNSNIGHFYHNELTALHHIIKSNDIKNFDKVICFRHIPLNIRKFIKSLNSDIEVEDFSSDMQFVASVDSCKFALRVTDCTVSKQLANDLIAYSNLEPPKISFENRRDFVKVVISIRTGRRQLLNQVEVFKDAVKLLYKTFRKVIVVFDGITKVQNQDITNFYDEENNIVDQILEGIEITNDLQFEKIIGFTFEEKIAIVNQCDFAITVKGNGIHPIIQWIANLPSFVHGNSTDLGVVYESNLGEDLDMPFVVSPTIVEDTSLTEIVVAGAWSGRQVDSYRIESDKFIKQLSIFLSYQLN
jgi:hypothetical protein